MITLIENIHELLRQGLPQGTFKEYYIGIPVTKVENLLPCVATEIVSMTSRLGPTGMDIDVYTMNMYVFFPKKQGVKEQHAKGELGNYRRMLDLLNKLDFTGTYATREDGPKSIMQILRSHLFLAGNSLNTSTTEKVINNDIDILLGPTNNEESFYYAKLTFKVSQYIQIANRI